MIPSRISENPMSASVYETSGEQDKFSSSTPSQVLNQQLSENLTHQPTIVNHLKNIINEFIDGKKKI